MIDAMVYFQETYLCRAFHRSLTCGLALLATACGDGGTEPEPAAPPEPPRATSVTVTPANAELTALGATVQLSAQVRDQNGRPMAGASVNWSSGATSVATVTGAGLVTAVGNGTATITASAGSATAAATVTVSQTVDAVTVTPASATLTAGETVRLAAEAVDANGHVVPGATFTWVSSDPAVARVDATGLVTALGAGATTITAASAGVTGAAQVTVTVPMPTTMTVSPADLAFTAFGETAQLAAQVRDQNGRPMPAASVSWSSSATSVATVNDAGLVTAIGNGTATITAAAGSVTAAATVTVSQTVNAVAVTPASATLTVGETVRLAAEAVDANGHVVPGATFTWVSSEPSVARVDATGLVTALGVGGTIITAASSGVAGAAQVTVTGPTVATVMISPATALIAPGDTLRLVASAFDANGHPVPGAEFDWSSNAGSVARVDGSGLVRGVEEGRARITAESGAARGTADITVENPDRKALTALYDATGGANWDNRRNWLTQAALRNWYGVVTGGRGRVIALGLRRNNLRGVMPPELGDLTGLTEIDFGSNDLRGPIPREFGSLRNLTRLRLRWNELTGTIPRELADLTNLTVLDLYWNELAGPIPREFANLTNLAELNLGLNDLTGSIPTELATLRNLTELNLGGNDLTGPIPPELADLDGLTKLDLGGNALRGRIPPEIGNLVNLTDLELEANNLTGPIPPEIGNLSGLSYLDLGINGLNSIPSEIGNLGGNLQFLLLWHNNFSGAIPPEIGNLTNLRTLYLNDNNFSGRIPAELGNLTRLSRLSLENNNLNGPLPESFLQLGNLTDLEISGNPRLCVPDTAAFTTWLNGIDEHDADKVSRCSSGDG